MQEQRGTRRWLLGVLAVLMAASTALGGGTGANAEDNGPYQRPGFDSREDFRRMCELNGGTFFGDLYRIACYIPGYGWIDCDNDGKDCWTTPESGRPRPLPGGPNQYDGSIDEVAPGGDQSIAAPADDHEPKAKAKHGKGKKGKHGKKHGRGGKGKGRK